MKLYGPSLSGNVARVMACLEEKGVDYELVAVNMIAGEHKKPPHILRNVLYLSLSHFACQFVELLFFHEIFSDWFCFLGLSLQPFGQVPALEDGDLMLFGELLHPLNYLILRYALKLINSINLNLNCYARNSSLDFISDGNSTNYMYFSSY